MDLNYMYKFKVERPVYQQSTIIEAFNDNSTDRCEYYIPYCINNIMFAIVTVFRALERYSFSCFMKQGFNSSYTYLPNVAFVSGQRIGRRVLRPPTTYAAGNS